MHSANQMNAQEFVMVTFVPFKATESNRGFIICGETPSARTTGFDAELTLEIDHCNQRGRLSVTNVGCNGVDAFIGWLEQ